MATIFALIAVFVGVVVVVVKRTSQLDISRISQSSLTHLPEVRCVKCGKPMEEGFVATSGVSWRAFNSLPRRFTGSGEKLRNILSDQSMLIFSHGVPESRAFRCDSCNLLVIDHSKLFVFEK